VSGLVGTVPGGEVTTLSSHAQTMSTTRTACRHPAGGSDAAGAEEDHRLRSRRRS
jgi:hypothetical protein